MPEGDTVRHTADRLGAALTGRRLVRAELRVPRHATADLRGRTVLDVTPRGKHLLTRLDGGLTLHSHLRMTGAWRVHPAGRGFSGGPAHEIRAILGTADATAVGYRLPVLDLVRTADEHRLVGHLGPDLLGPDWDAAEARRRLLADPDRPVGDALLDQRSLAGVGNVFMNELCFLARVTPWLPAGLLPDPDALLADAWRLLDANRGGGPRTTTGPETVARSGRRLYVYGAAGRPCARCRTAIRVAYGEPAGGHRRPAYWCPRCQQGPAPGGRAQRPAA
ncbi:DNA-formamidopyrimidine glycosylase family protein [Streptomyces sp. RFCAC02]|uniref:Fpg/Nei family DNA glycosylase n=1 Tax=Streptomyces sp. RFCAC02 TaxID=2499143 RepID=UPI001020EC05|nr:DNA-formamidopyrimidine glycosylase family protein [Streptomyces sp. RFCAC02]